MRKFFPAHPAALLALVALFGLFIAPGLAQTDPKPPTDGVAPVEQFSGEVDKLKKSFADVGKQIEDSAKTIDGLTDIEKARKEIEALREIVGNLLGTVSDNGAVAQLGAKALDHARAKLKALEQETRFSREDQQLLLGEWRKLIEETERAADDLGNARQEFAQLLRVLQTREDFIDELVQIRRANEALVVLRQLTKDIRDASASLKRLIGAIKPPGA
jgi:DNA repair exonuclease SbcCD ATPase subunit